MYLATPVWLNDTGRMDRWPGEIRGVRGNVREYVRAGARAAVEERAAPARPGILLDGNGTIIFDHGYIGSVDRVELIAGAAEAIARFNRARMPAASSGASAPERTAQHDFVLPGGRRRTGVCHPYGRWFRARPGPGDTARRVHRQPNRLLVCVVGGGYGVICSRQNDQKRTR